MGGWVGVRGHGSVRGGGNPGATDMYVAGRADVRMDLRDGYCLSGDRGEYTTPVLLHFMHLGKNLRAGKRRQWNGLYLARRKIFLVDMTAYVDRTVAQACRHCLVHVGPTQIPHAGRCRMTGQRPYLSWRNNCCVLRRVPFASSISLGPNFLHIPWTTNDIPAVDG